MSLGRFHRAQASPVAGYDVALNEIREGCKTGHWIWYVFPQLVGLGTSPTARHYAIRDLKEAREYLSDSILRARYEEIAVAVRERLSSGVAVESLMGSQIDALKLVSSLTLFRGAARSLASENSAFAFLAQCCDSILEQTTAQGYSPCPLTESALNNQH